MKPSVSFRAAAAATATAVSLFAIGQAFGQDATSQGVQDAHKASGAKSDASATATVIPRTEAAKHIIKGHKITCAELTAQHKVCYAYVTPGLKIDLNAGGNADQGSIPQTPTPKALMAAAPPPPPRPPEPPTGPMAGLGFSVFDASKAISLPMVRISAEEMKKIHDNSGCNRGGIGDALTHPLNARCEYMSDSRSVTVVGVMGHTPDNKTVLVVTNPTVFQETETYRADRGEGWFHAGAQLVGLALQGWQVEIAEQGLHLTQNLNANIIGGIQNGSFTSLFGSLGGCGNATSVGSTVSGGVKANCVIGSSITDSSIGQSNATRSTGTTSAITQTYGLGS